MNYFSIRKSVEYVHSAVDRVHGASSQGPWLSLNTDRLPLDLRPRSNNPNHFSKINLWPLISKRTTDRLLPHMTVLARTETGRHHGRWRESSNSRYKAPNTTWFLRTWSRRREEPVLHTYVGENQQWKTGNSGAVRTTLGGSVWLLRWSSGDKNKMNRLLTFPSYSSMLQFLRSAMNWTRTVRNPWRLGFGACRTKFDEYELLFIGLLCPTHRGDGVPYFLSINRTLLWLHLEDFWKGLNFRLVAIWKLNSRPG
jgi:hypothetical protein